MHKKVFFTYLACNNKKAFVEHSTSDYCKNEDFLSLFKILHLFVKILFCETILV